MKRVTSRSVLLLAAVCVAAAVMAPFSATAKRRRSCTPVAQKTQSPAARDTKQQWGHLSGRFVFDGKPPEVEHVKVDKDVLAFGKPIVDERLIINAKNRGIANVVLFLAVKKVDKLSVHPWYETAANAKIDLTIHHGRYEPHITLVRVGQTLVLKNKDPVSHNLNMPFLKNRPSNLISPPIGDLEWKFTKAERLPTTIHCNIHPWMKGRVLIMDHPYMAKTDADGRFEIKNLPVGEHTLKLWHAEAGYVREIRFGTDKDITSVKRGRLTVTIKPGDNDQGDLHVPPSLFEK